MIKLTDFNAGDKAYMLAERTGKLITVNVVKVGRKYVTLDNKKRFSQQSSYEFCLADNWEYGTRHYLFKTEEDYKKYIKKIEVLHDFIGRYRLEVVKLTSIEKALSVLKDGEQHE